MPVQISDYIKSRLPSLRLAIILGEVKNSESDSVLQQHIESEAAQIKSSFIIEDINKRPAIAATRSAYKVLGKDPNRYRPSAEALCRRILRDIPVYRISTLVDIINIVSIRSGFSIGGFDADKIEGPIILGVGQEDEAFEAIGRGLLNIEGLPVFRDLAGGIGTPTSDHERTKLTMNTSHLLMIINCYNGDDLMLSEAVEHSKALLCEFAELRKFSIYYV